MNEEIPTQVAKQWWSRCVSCSEASLTTQNRGTGITDHALEQALHVFSGGFMHSGHACGLLTGATLAAGFAARARFDNDETRSAATLHAAIQLANAYPQLALSINCRDITGLSLTRMSGRLRYAQEGKGRLCGRLHLQWATRAHQLIDRSLAEFEERRPTGACANCAVQTLRELTSSAGMKTRDGVLVAGFAGGVGLSGNVCGALAAGVFALAVRHQLMRKQNRRDSRTRALLQELTGANYRGAATRLRLDFIRRFDSVLCAGIIGRHFRDAGDHSSFIEHGGCEKLTRFVAAWVADHSAEE